MLVNWLFSCVLPAHFKAQHSQHTEDAAKDKGDYLVLHGAVPWEQRHALNIA